MHENNGKIVKFTTNHGNEFRAGDIAVCLDGESGLFLGLSGRNLLKSWYESGIYEVIGTDRQEVNVALGQLREKYYK